MRESLEEYCSRNARRDLLEQWHPERNCTLTPSDISFGSHKKVWWRCQRGHIWQSPLYARTSSNSGCPYCAGKKVHPGNDLKSVYPEIAAQWHPRKNTGYGPEQTLPGSHKAVWWRCEQGHEWKAMVKTRVEGNGCPVCANRIVIPGMNDLQTVLPLLAEQWHPTRNGGLKPTHFHPGSSRRVWWRCDKGHDWQADIQSRSAGSGCPVCSGKMVVSGENDLETIAPAIAAQWVQTKNGSLLPSQVTAYSNKSVWWRCELGHEWKASINSRTFSASGCPYCARRKVLSGFNDLQTLEPKVAAQWHPTLNGQLAPTMVMPGCRKKVWWRCMDGHVWKAAIYSRTGKQKCGCPVCAGRIKQNKR